VYTIFGRVTAGTDVVDAIAQVPVGDPRVGVPLTPVIIDSITISATPDASPGE
jgi:cyclophilin family peptidyl-prolyl cis-trans isomerase